MGILLPSTPKTKKLNWTDSLTCMTVQYVQWNLSIKDTHLSNEVTAYCQTTQSCIQIYLSTRDTLLYSWVPMASFIERFHCTCSRITTYRVAHSIWAAFSFSIRANIIRCIGSVRRKSVSQRYWGTGPLGCWEERVGQLCMATCTITLLDKLKSSVE